MGATIDQLRHRREREKRLQAEVNTLVALAAEFEDERDAALALVADLVEALEQAKCEHDDNCPHDDPDVMECRCGAAEHNAPIDTALAHLRAVLP